MPALDTQTLLVAISLMALVSAMVMFLLWRINPAQRGVLMWFVASLLQAAAYASPLMPIAGGVGVVFNNVLIITSLLLMLEGALQFRGHPTDRRWLLAGLLLPIAAVFIVINVDNPLLRYRVIDFYTAAVFFSIAVVMVRRTENRQVLIIYSVAALFCTMVGVLVSLRWLIALTTTSTVSIAEPLYFNSIVFLGFLVFSAGWTYSITLACYFRAQQSALALAREDPLTGLPNRRGADEALEQEVQRARRSGKAFSLILLDLDGFKAVNDTMGHAAGDAVLVRVARRLTEQVRESDFISRLGGDEFLVILHTADSASEQQTAMDRFRQCLELPFALDGQKVRVRASAGAAQWGKDGDTADELLRAADKRMYQNKATETSG